MIKKPQECAKGNHIFVISNWNFDTKSQKSNGWTCQKCLLTVEGKSDIDALRAKLHEAKNDETKA
jgi:hypothetical protein